MFLLTGAKRSFKTAHKLFVGCFVIIALLFSLTKSFGWNTYIDSLETKLKTSKGSEECLLLNTLSSNYLTADPEKAKNYAERALANSEKLNFETGKAYSLINIGWLKWSKGEFQSAIEYYLDALKIFEKLNDYKNQARALTNIGLVYQSQKKMDKALEYAQLSLNISEKSSNKQGLAESYNNIANVYYQQKDFKKTEEYYTKALKIFETLNHLNGIASTENNLGSVLMESRNYEEALRHFNVSITVYELLKNKNGIAVCLLNIGTTLSKEGKHQEANENLFKGLKTAREANSPETVLSSYDAIAEASSLAKNYAQAYDYQKKYSLLRDSLFTEESNRTTTEMMTRFETNKKENTIKIQQVTLERQVIIRNSIIAGLFLLLLLTGVIYNSYRNKQKTNLVLEQTNEELNTTLKNLKAAEANLVESEKMSSLGQLTAGIAHEINNPMTFIQASLNPLKRGLQDVIEVLNKVEALIPEDKKQVVEKIKKESTLSESVEEISSLLESIEAGVTRTTAVVSGLQSFTRLDESAFKLNNLNQGINSTLLLIQSRIYDKKISLVKSLDKIPDVPCFPGKINQVLMNIIINAVEAIGNKENGEIIIESSANEKEVIISIKDNGSGMTDDIRNKIFEPFFTTKDVGQGPGLGLSIAYGTIESHKGKIDVKSTVGVGSEFIIRLPLSNTLDS